MKEEIREVRLGDIQDNQLNRFFFDDIEGEKWDDFKASVKDGLIERPILTQNLVLVSGHQRIRAKRENGESTDTKVSCVVRHYENDDDILRDMIETNIQQRGTLSCSAVKMGRIAMALENINRVRRGRPKKSDIANNVGNMDDRPSKTQEEIASMLDENIETYRLNKKLAQLPPEIQDMVERGQITPSTAARLIARMDEASQEKLMAMMPNDIVRKYTQSEIQGYIDKIRALEEHLAVAQTAISGGTDEWIRLSHERDQAKEKARKEYEIAQVLQRSVRENEKQMEKLQRQWEIAQARADGSMFQDSPFVLIDSAMNSYLRALEFIRQSKVCFDQLDDNQTKYISSLFTKAAQLTSEVNRAMRTTVSRATAS